METLSEAFDAVARRETTLEVYAADGAVADGLERQFATRNVRVTRRPLPPAVDAEFVVVRDATGAFRGAVGLDRLRVVLSPQSRAPWSGADRARSALLELLSGALFASRDRAQMLATTREIEDRAWRLNGGTLYVGFQRPAALRAQRAVYERFVRERDLSVRAFVAEEWVDDGPDGVDVVSEAGGELGRFWFVVFDGAGGDASKCGLVAEERAPGRYYGFWTYDPALVDELTAYLRSRYGDGGSRRSQGRSSPSGR
jgi:hypothetical protein